MSDPQEKLETTPGSAGPARATLAQLRMRWGELVLLEGTEQEPRRFRLVSGLGCLEDWRWIGGGGRNAVFEMDSKREG